MSNKSNKLFNLNRRRFLSQLIAIVPLSAIAPPLVQASISRHNVSEGVVQHYQPHYFTQPEWDFLLAACGQLIPSDHYGPGAIEEGVPQYIDKQMELPYGYGHLMYMHPPFVEAEPEFGYQLSYTPRQFYREAISAINRYCTETFGHPFAALSSAQQIEFLKQLEQDKLTFSTFPGVEFFTLLLQHTREGYLSDPIHGGNQSLASWKLIGFPGARADFTDWSKHPNQRYPQSPVSISSKRGY